MACLFWHHGMSVCRISVFLTIVDNTDQSQESSGFSPQKKKMTHQNGAFCVCGPDRTSGNAGAFLDRHSTNLKDAAPELQVDLLYNPR